MARYAVNPAGVKHCKRLIAAHQYVLDSRWGDVQPSAADETAFLDGHDWDAYGEWFLGLTEGAGEHTKGRYAFVLGDLRRIHRSAVIASHYRAAEWRHKQVELAAHELLQELDAAAGIG